MQASREQPLHAYGPDWVGTVTFKVQPTYRIQLERRLRSHPDQRNGHTLEREVFEHLHGMTDQARQMIEATGLRVEGNFERFVVSGSVPALLACRDRLLNLFDKTVRHTIWRVMDAQVIHRTAIESVPASGAPSQGAADTATLQPDPQEGSPQAGELANRERQGSLARVWGGFRSGASWLRDRAARRPRDAAL